MFARVTDVIGLVAVVVLGNLFLLCVLGPVVTVVPDRYRPRLWYGFALYVVGNIALLAVIRFCTGECRPQPRQNEQPESDVQA
jgi:hypothetical protein